MKRGFLTLLAAALLSGSAWASGYQVLLQSNRSTAMGNIGVGLRPDPSSINFNPGALAMMRQNGIQVGANLIYSRVAFREFGSNTTFETDNPTGTPFHLFAAFGSESPLAFGLGVYTPYGSTVNWGNEWIGQFSLTQLSLSAIFIQPTVSYRLSDNFSIGAGLIYSIGNVNLQRNIDLRFSDGTYSSSELDGAAGGWGYNLGAYFTPNEKLSLGINYRSRVTMKIEDGNATFRAPSIAYQSGNLPESTTFSSELPLPSYLTLGFSFKPTNAFLFGVDISRAGWSAYERLGFEFGAPVNGQTELSDARNYKSSWTYKLGAEYAIVENFRLRAGGYYDETPVQEGYLTPETPDANTVGLTAGFGLSISEKISVDGSFLYINKKQRDNTEIAEVSDRLYGTYKSKAFIPGVSVTINF